MYTTADNQKCPPSSHATGQRVKCTTHVHGTPISVQRTQSNDKMRPASFPWCECTICTHFQLPIQGPRLQNAATHRRGNRHQTQLHSFRCFRCLGQFSVNLNYIHRTQAPGLGARLCNIQCFAVVQSSTYNCSCRRCNLFEQSGKQPGWGGGGNSKLCMLVVNFHSRRGIPTRPERSPSGFRRSGRHCTERKAP